MTDFIDDHSRSHQVTEGDHTKFHQHLPEDNQHIYTQLAEDNNKSTHPQPTNEEIFKIKLSLSSLKNSVIVCPTTAILYTQSPTDTETWMYLTKGVPVLILKKSMTGCLVSVQLGFSSRESGFLIWKDELTKSSEYTAVQENFHTFKLTSKDNRTTLKDNGMAGIRFPCDQNAKDFHDSVQNNVLGIRNPEVYTEPVLDEGKFEKQNAKKKTKLRKEDISRPCMFNHVTKGNNKGPRYQSLLI